MAGVKGPRPCLGLLGKGDWPLSTRSRTRLSRGGGGGAARAPTHMCMYAYTRAREPYASKRARARARRPTHVSGTRVQEAIRELERGLLRARAVLFARRRLRRSLSHSPRSLNVRARVRSRVPGILVCEIIFS